MIVGVWAYGIICWLEARKEIGKSLGQAGETTETAEKIKARKKAAGVKLRKKLLQDTGMCLAGYLTALLVLFGYIQIRYGMDEYVKGILRLFSMTEVATDYTAASMIMGMFDWYFQNLYWEIRMCVFFVVGIVAVGVLELIGSYVRKDTVTKVLRILEWAGSIALAAVMVFWLYRQGFCAREYTNYGAIIWPGVTFLTLTLLVTLWRIFTPSAPREEKLISGLIFLIVWITSLGSNNKLYPSMNNLFLALPYMYWQFYRFCKYVGSFRWKRITISAMPVKCLLGGFFLLFFVQVGLFGRNFAFAEGTGIQDIDAQVTNNETLKGVWMSEERAGWMQGISEYVNERGLAGRDVLIYGQIPAAVLLFTDACSVQSLAGSGFLPERTTWNRICLRCRSGWMRMLLIARWYCWRRNMPCIWKRERMPWKHYSPRKRERSLIVDQSQAFADRKIHGRLWV